jgi:hypothetical protein
VLVEHLNQRGEPTVVDDTLAGGRGVEVDHVDDAGETRILARCRADSIG